MAPISKTKIGTFPGYHFSIPTNASNSPDKEDELREDGRNARSGKRDQKLHTRSQVPSAPSHLLSGICDTFDDQTANVHKTIPFPYLNPKERQGEPMYFIGTIQLTKWAAALKNGAPSYHVRVEERPKPF